MHLQVIINGKFAQQEETLLSLENKSFRYGDGFFETMKLREGKLLLAEDHFRRFFHTASLLGYTLPASLSRQRLEEEISLLTQKNKCTALARIRLSAWRGQGGLFEGDDALQYAIECRPLNSSVLSLNENGLVIGVYTHAVKNADRLANCKTSNFLIYSLAARHARIQKWNDAIVLNHHGRVADTCITNLFLIRKGIILTPPLGEGPVAGVFRQQLLNTGQVREMPLTVEDLETADEIFLTNAIRGIHWVRQLGERIYGFEATRQLYHQIGQTFL